MHTLTIYQNKKQHSVSFEGSPTVQEVLETNGIIMPHPCGGNGRCGKCAIEIMGDISVPDEVELALGHRLSCRTKLYGDAIVTLSCNNAVYAETSRENITYAAGQSDVIGAAVDIGTTTVALSVYDLKTGTCLASETMLNPQATVAADVIGRIHAAASGRLIELQDMLISCIHSLALQSGYLAQIDRWCITGNTTMLYLLQGTNPHQLAIAPFIADDLFGRESTFFDKPAYLPDCMHAFVGADITCAVLASNMCCNKETALLCDIGTNGEIALWKNGKLYTTSTAAGPAFEGAGISCGCQSVRGAIEAVRVKKNALEIETIENKEPVGLCGSGIIDLVACLLDLNLIDKTGAMKDNEFFLYKDINFNQSDVRSVQLAKAAIAAGIRTLLSLTDTKTEDISAFYIAGGFGSHLNLPSAVRIGLFPGDLQNKTKILGNAALKGAASMLIDCSQKEKAHVLAVDSEHISLGGNPLFNQIYIEEMTFPIPIV